MLTSLQRIFRFSLENISRNRSLFIASIFIMIIITSLISSLYLLRGTTNFLIASLEEKVDISVYFNLETEEEDIFQVQKELSEIPEVKAIEYISREEALVVFKEKHKDNPVIIESLREIGDNPLAAHLNIKAWQASQYEQISKFLESSLFESVIDKVDYHQNRNTIRRLFSITSTIERVSLLFIAVCVILAILVAFNTVRLGAMSFSKEISVMRLVGASNWFIRGPFVIESIIAAVMSALIISVLFGVGCYLIAPKVEVLITGFNLFDFFKSNLLILILIQLGSALTLGIIPSLFAIRKYLRV